MVQLYHPIVVQQQNPVTWSTSCLLFASWICGRVGQPYVRLRSAGLGCRPTCWALICLTPLGTAALGQGFSEHIIRGQGERGTCSVPEISQSLSIGQGCYRVMPNLKGWENTPHSTPVGDPASQMPHGCVVLTQGGCEGCGRWFSLLWGGRKVSRLVLVFFKKICLFTYFWLCWVFLAARAFF